MKFGQVKEYNKRNIFLQKLMQEMRQEDSFRTFCFFLIKKALHELKASGLQLSFNMFW